ncbi:MAG: 4-hydroxy-tetrahydrodipicolinate reductase, partial [Halocynthiibacter sp.]
MTDLPGVVITGASGRMGQMLIKTITGGDKLRLVAAL